MESAPPEASMVLETWTTGLSQSFHHSALSATPLEAVGVASGDWPRGPSGPASLEAAQDPMTKALRIAGSERRRLDRIIWPAIEGGWSDDPPKATPMPVLI